LRVGEMLRHALADVLRRGDLRDPDLEGVSVTITQVKPSGDMRYATIFCEPLGGRNAKATVAALNRQLHQRDEQGELVRRDKLAFVKNPLNVLQEIELAPVAGRSGHLPLPLQ